VSRLLVLTLDVTGLTEVQVDSLRAHLWAQTEAYDDDYPDIDGDQSYPDVTVVNDTVIDIPPAASGE
jgi:hypothetical protein